MSLENSVAQKCVKRSFCRMFTFSAVSLMGCFVPWLNDICILNCVILNFGADVSSGRFIDILYSHLICSVLSLKLYLAHQRRLALYSDYLRQPV